MPARIQESWPLPFLSRTLTAQYERPGRRRNRCRWRRWCRPRGAVVMVVITTRGAGCRGSDLADADDAAGNVQVRVIEIHARVDDRHVHIHPQSVGTVDADLRIIQGSDSPDAGGHALGTGLNGGAGFHVFHPGVLLDNLRGLHRHGDGKPFEGVTVEKAHLPSGQTGHLLGVGGRRLFLVVEGDDQSHLFNGGGHGCRSVSLRQGQHGHLGVTALFIASPLLIRCSDTPEQLSSYQSKFSITKPGLLPPGVFCSATCCHPGPPNRQPLPVLGWRGTRPVCRPVAHGPCRGQPVSPCLQMCKQGGQTVRREDGV